MLEVVELAVRAANAGLSLENAALQAQAQGLASLEQVAISAVWVVASLVLMGLGLGLKVRDLRILAIALFDLTIVKAFFYDLSGLQELYRIVAFMGLGTVLLVVSYVYQRFERGQASGAVADDVLPAPASP